MQSLANQLYLTVINSSAKTFCINACDTYKVELAFS